MPSPCSYSVAHLVSFQGMKIFFMVVAAVYVLYLLFLIVRACSELRHMPYVGTRHITGCPRRVGPGGDLTQWEEWLESSQQEA